MKITSKEVKTIYNIEIDWMDICKLAKEHKLPFAGFESIENKDAGEITRAEVVAILKKISAPSMTVTVEQSRNNSLAVQLLAHALGFDKVENYGHWCDKKDCYRLEVANFGNDF